MHDALLTLWLWTEAVSGRERAHEKAALRRLDHQPWARLHLVSALARLETRIGLADHEDLATAADDLAVAVTGLRRLQGGQDLHDKTSADGFLD